MGFSARRLIVLLCAAALAGCVEVAKYPQLEPVSFRPDPSAPRAPVEVGTLTPRFEWKPAGPGIVYDFVIWDILPDGTVGDTVVRETGLAACSYTPEHPLLPDHDYYWSVRRSGSADWATLSFAGANPLAVAWMRGVPFRIHTPEARS